MWKDWKRAPCITAAYFISLRVVCNLCVCVCGRGGRFTSSSRVYTRWYSCSRSITYVVAWWRKKGRLSKESGSFTIKLKNLNLPVSMLFNLPRFWNWNFGLIMGFFFFLLNGIFVKKQAHNFYFLFLSRFFVAIARVERNRFPFHFKVPALAYKLQDSN